MRNIRKLIVLIVLVCVCFICFACDDTGTSNKTTKADPNNVYPRAVNNKESSLLSQTLFHNNQIANANFTIKSGVLGSGGFVGEGKVDWKNQIVAIKVYLHTEDQIDIGAITNSDGVFESVLDLNAELTAAGKGSYNWIKRNFDASKYGIDALSQFILKLGATAPDNPLLIKQNGAQILGVENVNGVKTFKMQNTDAVTYYVAEDDTLMRVEADIKGFKGAATIDLSGQTQAIVDLPAESDAISIDKVSELYTKLRPNF